MNFGVWVIPVLLTVLVLGFAIETYFLVRLYSHYNRLIKGHSKEGLISVLEGIQKNYSALERRVAKSEKELEELETKNQSNLQHLVVRRFNPFSNTGGDQSFVLGLLDGNQDGVVITSLHSRENTRFYIKQVVKGEGSPHPLSDDEKMIFKKG